MCRSQLLRVLRCRSATARMLGFGAECRRGLGCLSVMSVVCLQVEVSALGWSLVQRNLTECDVSECDREASIMRWPCPTGGCWTVGRNKTKRYGYKLVVIISVKKCSTLNKFYVFNMRLIRQLNFSPRRFTWHRLCY